MSKYFQKQKLNSFSIFWKNSFKKFYSKEKDIKKFKSIISGRVIFGQISDFYDPIALIGNGSSSKVTFFYKGIHCPM